MANIGLVLGAGGIVGAAFHEGVLRAIAEETGWDPASAEIIVGTSAGSHVGAVLRSGHAAGAVRAEVRPVDPQAVTVRRRGPGAPGLLLRGIARPGGTRMVTMLTGLVPDGRISTSGLAAGADRLHRGGWPRARLWLPAVRLRDGRRVVFGQEGAPPATVGAAVAASCAIPGYFQPVVIDGERYVDGGVHSSTNLDLLAGEGLDLVVVSAPMAAARGVRSASAALQARGYMRWRLGAEARAVRRSGTPVVAFSPTVDDLEVMGWNAMAQGRRQAVIDRAAESALRRLRDPRWREAMAALSA